MLSLQFWLWAIVGGSCALYIAIAFRARARTTADFYVADRHVGPIANGMATADAIVSGLAPGSPAVTTMIGKSTFGRSLTGRSG